MFTNLLSSKGHTEVLFRRLNDQVNILPTTQDEKPKTPSSGELVPTQQETRSGWVRSSDHIALPSRQVWAKIRDTVWNFTLLFQKSLVSAQSTAARIETLNARRTSELSFSGRAAESRVAYFCHVCLRCCRCGQRPLFPKTAARPRHWQTPLFFLRRHICKKAKWNDLFTRIFRHLSSWSEFFSWGKRFPSRLSIILTTRRTEKCWTKVMEFNCLSLKRGQAM